MSRFATDEIPEPMYRDFVDGLLDGTIKKYKEEIKEKMDEINNDIKEAKVVAIVDPISMTAVGKKCDCSKQL